MHAVIFLPAAQIEASEAQDWYEAEARNLGAAFRAELDNAVQRLTANPLQFPPCLCRHPPRAIAQIPLRPILPNR